MSTKIPEDLEKFIREEAGNLGYEIVDMAAKGSRGLILEIVLDKEGGITLDECGAFNRGIMTWIDSQNMFEGGYVLDVCSPGLDRPLKSDSDFAWAVGRQVEIKTHDPIEGRNLVIGKLVEASGEKDITIEEEGGNTLSIDRNNVAKAKLWFKT